MKKVLIGCAIAFGVVALSGIIGTVVLVNKFKEALPDIEQATQMEARLVERDGPVEDAILPLDGSIDPYLVEKYLRVTREMHRRNEPDVEQLQRFVIGLGEEKEGAFGGIKKLSYMVKGGLGLAQMTFRVSVTADSLLWEGDISRAELVYLTGLIRQGAVDWEPPVAEGGDTNENARARQEEVEEAIDSLHEQFERNFRRLLRNQRRQLAEMPSRSEAEEAWFATLEEVLANRSTFMNIKGQLLESQLEVLSPHMTELTRLAATSLPAYYLELIPMVDDEDEDGMSITIGD